MARDMSEHFGNYRLMAELGNGSLGEVYAAEDESGQKLALKRLQRAHLSSETHRALFEKELGFARNLRGPGLLHAIGGGDVEGWPYLTTTLISGPSLKELLRSAPLDSIQAWHLAKHLGESLYSLHELGLLHCDLNPSNVLMGSRPFLGDFSATTRRDEAQARVQGSYAYMSPEQVKGETLRPASDVFAMAALLWQCFSQERAFDGNSQPAILQAVVSGEPRLAEKIPDAFHPVLLRALTKSPRSRLATIPLFLQALQDSLKQADLITVT